MEYRLSIFGIGLSLVGLVVPTIWPQALTYFTVPVLVIGVVIAAVPSRLIQSISSCWGGPERCCPCAKLLVLYTTPRGDRQQRHFLKVMPQRLPVFVCCFLVLGGPPAYAVLEAFIRNCEENPRRPAQASRGRWRRRARQRNGAFGRGSWRQAGCRPHVQVSETGGSPSPDRDRA